MNCTLRILARDVNGLVQRERELEDHLHLENIDIAILRYRLSRTKSRSSPTTPRLKVHTDAAVKQLLENTQDTRRLERLKPDDLVRVF